MSRNNFQMPNFQSVIILLENIIRKCLNKLYYVCFQLYFNTASKHIK